MAEKTMEQMMMGMMIAIMGVLMLSQVVLAAEPEQPSDALPAIDIGIITWE